MRISCLPTCFFDDIRNGSFPLSEWHSIAAKLGFDGVEVYTPFLESTDKDYLLRLRKDLRKLNLDVSLLTGFGNLGSTSPKEWQGAVNESKHNVEIAAIIGAPSVRVIAGKWRIGSTRDTQFNYTARALREIIAFATNYGVQIALENHPEIGTKIEDFVEIVRRVNLAGLKVNLHTSNMMLSGGDPVALTKDVKGRVVHVRASDRVENLDLCSVGQGTVDFPAIFKILKGVGFDGWISIEIAGVQSEEAIQWSLNYIKHTWEAA